MVQWLRLYLPMQGVQVQFLVGELRPHTPRSQKNQNMEQKQCCNQFNKDCKNDPHQKILKLNKHHHNTIFLTPQYQSPISVQISLRSALCVLLFESEPQLSLYDMLTCYLSSLCHLQCHPILLLAVGVSSQLTHSISGFSGLTSSQSPVPCRPLVRLRGWTRGMSLVSQRTSKVVLCASCYIPPEAWLSL